MVGVPVPLVRWYIAASRCIHRPQGEVGVPQVVLNEYILPINSTETDWETFKQPATGEVWFRRLSGCPGGVAWFTEASPGQWKRFSYNGALAEQGLSHVWLQPGPRRWFLEGDRAMAGSLAAPQGQCPPGAEEADDGLIDLPDSLQEQARNEARQGGASEEEADAAGAICANLMCLVGCHPH